MLKAKDIQNIIQLIKDYDYIASEADGFDQEYSRVNGNGKKLSAILQKELQTTTKSDQKIIVTKSQIKRLIQKQKV